jgi:catechol 2,3-dioxygenase-like lactoylglutathione lyase family enzyme
MRTLVSLLCFVPLAIGAQEPQPVLRTSDTFFALSVADAEASARWYSEKLGLMVTNRLPRNDQTKSSMILVQGGGLTVELVQHDEAVPLRNFIPEPRGSLYVHGIFKVGVAVDNFDEAIAALRARGVAIPIGPFPRRPDQPANAIIQDNAGNYIQIFGKD